MKERGTAGGLLLGLAISLFFANIHARTLTPSPGLGPIPPGGLFRWLDKDYVTKCLEIILPADRGSGEVIAVAIETSLLFRWVKDRKFAWISNPKFSSKFDNGRLKTPAHMGCDHETTWYSGHLYTKTFSMKEYTNSHPHSIRGIIVAQLDVAKVQFVLLGTSTNGGKDVHTCGLVMYKEGENKAYGFNSVNLCPEDGG